MKKPYNEDISWSEQEYLSYLESERDLYAWTLIRYGNYSEADARTAARDFYQYQPPDAPHRGLVFHDEAWHWAMLKIFGPQYWKIHPEYESATKEYRARAV